MEYKGRIVPVKFTVLEYKITNNNLRLYDIEAIDIELRQKNKGVGMSGPDKQNSAYPDTSSRTPYKANILHLFDSVNDYFAGINNTVKIYRSRRPA